MYPYVRWRREALSDFCFNYWIFVKHIFVSRKPWIELTDRNLLDSSVTQWRHRAHGHHLPFRKELESSHFISRWSAAALCAFWAIPTIVFMVPLHRTSPGSQAQTFSVHIMNIISFSLLHIGVDALGSQTRVSDPLTPQSEEVVSLHVYLIHVFCKSSKCS